MGQTRVTKYTHTFTGGRPSIEKQPHHHYHHHHRRRRRRYYYILVA